MILLSSIKFCNQRRRNEKRGPSEGMERVYSPPTTLYFSFIVTLSQQFSVVKVGTEGWLGSCGRVLICFSWICVIDMICALQ